MGKENRTLQRTRRRIAVTLGNKKAFTWDVSPGGFCIETMYTQKPGTDVTGTLELDAQSLPFTGKIAWSLAGDLRVMQRGRMGVRLTGVPDAYYRLFVA